MDERKNGVIWCAEMKIETNMKNVQTNKLDAKLFLLCLFSDNVQFFFRSYSSPHLFIYN